ncbi:MAG: TetR family transcriptional regulator [Alphaproteobacteria bacterium]|nr:MAG: TetR family transcriptional regulator [Alphaproteobacteria bacterium]
MSASKRDILVRGAMNVFYREGFNATGMDKLAKETGVSKMTMYKHFRSKEDLILAALRLRDDEFLSSFTRLVEEGAKTPKGRLLGVFDALADWIEGRDFYSCMFIKATSEYQSPEHPIHVASAEHKRKVLAFIQGLAGEAGAKNPKLLARQLFMLTEGETVTAFILGKSGVAADAKAAAKVLIEAALPGQNT